MYRNSLTFQGEELRRFRPWSVSRFKLEILRRLQRRSLAAADGVIVLSNHAMELVRKQGIHHEMVRIPHGVQDRFRAPPAGARSQFGRRILYVSSVAAYKHQWNVVEAVALLRTRGHDVTLRIVGPVIDRASARRMKAALNRFDASGEWASFEGPADYERLHEEYGAADIFVFASTCENMPNTLLEAMASGLPIVSSASGPMPEIAIDSVLYADPEDPVSLAVRLAEILTNPDLAAELRRKAQERAEDFTWSRTAAETFRYLVEIAEASTASGAAPR
jgi:glycosyltransferase involved in cell wall biosynthesis